MSSFMCHVLYAYGMAAATAHGEIALNKRLLGSPTAKARPSAILTKDLAGHGCFRAFATPSAMRTPKPIAGALPAHCRRADR
jgi:hypothetical protein